MKVHAADNQDNTTSNENFKDVKDKVSWWPEDIKDFPQSFIDTLGLIRKHMEDTKADEARATEWVLAAQVLDRVFFVVFLLLVVLVHLGILMNHP